MSGSILLKGQQYNKLAEEQWNELYEENPDIFSLSYLDIVTIIYDDDEPEIYETIDDIDPSDIMMGDIIITKTDVYYTIDKDPDNDDTDDIGLVHIMKVPEQMGNKIEPDIESDEEKDIVYDKIELEEEEEDFFDFEDDVGEEYDKDDLSESELDKLLKEYESEEQPEEEDSTLKILEGSNYKELASEAWKFSYPHKKDIFLQDYESIQPYIQDEYESIQKVNIWSVSDGAIISIEGHIYIVIDKDPTNPDDIENMGLVHIMKIPDVPEIESEKEIEEPEIELEEDEDFFDFEEDIGDIVEKKEEMGPEIEFKVSEEESEEEILIQNRRRKLAETVDKKTAIEYFNKFYGHKLDDMTKIPSWDKLSREAKIDLNFTNKARYIKKNLDGTGGKKYERVLQLDQPGSARYLNRMGPKTFDIEGVDTHKTNKKRVAPEKGTFEMPADKTEVMVIKDVDLKKQVQENNLKKYSDKHIGALAGSKIYKRARKLAMDEKGVKEAGKVTDKEIIEKVLKSIDTLKKEKYNSNYKGQLYKAGESKLTNDELYFWLKSGKYASFIKRIKQNYAPIFTKIVNKHMINKAKKTELINNNNN